MINPDIQSKVDEYMQELQRIEAMINIMRSDDGRITVEQREALYGAWKVRTDSAIELAREINPALSVYNISMHIYGIGLPTGPIPGIKLTAQGAFSATVPQEYTENN